MEVRPRPGRILVPFLAVVLIALAMRIVFLAQLSGTAQDEFQTLDILDTNTFELWARDIVAGDWAGRTPPHPYHEWWQGPIAPPEQWVRWFGGEAVYHQAPLYPYLMALVYAVSDDGRRAMQILQLVLGALHAGLVYLLARRFVGMPVAVVAGLMAALYGPLILYEGVLLRDALQTHVSTLSLFAAVMTLERRSWRWAAGTGLACGIAILTRPVALLFALGLAVLFFFLFRRGVLPLLIAVGLALAPVAVRNVALGVPPLKLTTRGPVAFINGNAADGPGVGWDPPPSTRAILERSNYRLLPTVVETLKTHRARPTGLLALQVKKARAYFGGDEIGNNLHYDHMRRAAGVLGTPPAVPHTLVATLGLAGLVIAWRRRRDFAPAYLLFACQTVATLGFFVISRFRQPLVPVLILFAAFWIESVVSLVRARDWKRLIAPAVLAAVFLAVTFPRLAENERYNAGVFAAEVMLWLQKNDVAAALETANESARIFPDHVPTQLLAGKMRLSAGQPAAAGEAFARALELDPQNVVGCTGAGDALIAVGSLAEGLDKLESCLELPDALANADLAYSLGTAYLKTDNVSGAEKAFARGLVLRPDDHRAGLAKRVVGSERPADP